MKKNKQILKQAAVYLQDVVTGESVKELLFPLMNQKNSDFLSSSITWDIHPPYWLHTQAVLVQSCSYVP